MSQDCKVWHNITGQSDEEVAQRIRSERIDILVDLSGHTSGNRLRVFARKPAPVQVSYLGYANTTGLPVIDYRLTDAHADPPGMTEGLNVEKLWRLPGCAWCFAAPEGAPEVKEREEGPITFGCFNAFAKMNPKIVAMWARLLGQVSGSRLVLKSAGAGAESSRGQVMRQFAELGIAGDRVEMLGWMDKPQRHLETYHRIDVALDTFPYHGTTTTCEALWMGAPVVTLAGRSHVSRVGVSLLSAVGLEELVAGDEEEYVSIAAALASDMGWLAALRAGLRQRMQASALMDAAGFAANVESAYREMWKKWYGQKP
jgi:predicted O-linked N-acetylglucosamine transferase (SPINDLY family)